MHRCLLAVNTKDERNWEEWARFHLAQGWTHLLLFDDFSSDQLRPAEIDARMTVRREHHLKTKYMNLALTFARERNFDYLLYIDMDEYVVLPRHDDLHAFVDALKHKHGRRPDVIHLHWLFFGSAFLDELPPAFRPASLVTHYTRSAAHLDHRIKSMVRPDRVHVSRDPHTYFFPPHVADPLVVTADGARSGVLHSAHYPHAQVPTRDAVHAYLAHYAHQCWTEFCRRRRRPRDDTGCVRKFPYVLAGRKGPSRFHHGRENAVDNDEPRRILEKWIDGEKIIPMECKAKKEDRSNVIAAEAATPPCRRHRLDAAILAAATAVPATTPCRHYRPDGADECAAARVTSPCRHALLDTATVTATVTGAALPGVLAAVAHESAALPSVLPAVADDSADVAADAAAADDG